MVTSSLNVFVEILNWICLYLDTYLFEARIWFQLNRGPACGDILMMKPPPCVALGRDEAQAAHPRMLPTR